MSNAMIKLENVTKKFGQTTVLKGINLSIYDNEITTIIGKSGIGKSVLLKHIIGLIKPDRGKILFKGKNINDSSSDNRKKINKKFSYMFQGTALFDYMTIYDNIALPIKEKNIFPVEEIRYRVQKQIEQFDLYGIEKKYPAQISGGMKKRVAMARALITEPEIVLFDEPTSGLDPIRKNAALSMIKKYQQDLRFSSIIVSHDIPEIFDISNKIVMIFDGKVIFEGTSLEIQNSNDPRIREFIFGK